MSTILKTLFAVFIAAVCLFGCSNEADSFKNVIAPKELTEEQNEIVSLLSVNNQEILLFEYKTQEVYQSLEFWVEVYKDGVFVSRPAGLHRVSNDFEELDGQLSVLITQNPGFQWSFSMNGASHMNSEPIFIDDTLVRGYGPINEPATIENGKEIVLYASIFSHGNIALHERQSYVEHPELVKGYPYVFLIKCKFSK